MAVGNQSRDTPDPSALEIVHQDRSMKLYLGFWQGNSWTITPNTKETAGISRS